MQSFIYQDSTIAFVTAAAQTCLLIEKCGEHERDEWREQLLRLLPILYLRTRLLEPAERMMEDEPQRLFQLICSVQVGIGILDQFKPLCLVLSPGFRPVAESVPGTFDVFCLLCQIIQYFLMLG